MLAAFRIQEMEFSISKIVNQFIFVKVSNYQFQHFRYLYVLKTGLVSICGRWSCGFDVAHPLTGVFLYVFYIASLDGGEGTQKEI